MSGVAAAIARRGVFEGGRGRAAAAAEAGPLAFRCSAIRMGMFRRPGTAPGAPAYAAPAAPSAPGMGRGGDQAGRSSPFCPGPFIGGTIAGGA
jgi:hypothetical protein